MTFVFFVFLVALQQYYSFKGATINSSTK